MKCMAHVFQNDFIDGTKDISDHCPDQTSLNVSINVGACIISLFFYSNMLIPLHVVVN